ncbi:nucleotidyltransferase domain-containing protein [Paenibacillus sp. EC2-1]|uniref:nucleotidyltransferase domain-containing protein n=1 Tax=Paenibacillus sp. EC2-1 TaxID=3388665 RepID=UPI003BEF0B72
MRTEPIVAARQLILRDYSACLLAVLGGSASRGEHNEHSDLDILVVDDSTEGLTRKTVGAYGWVVELFFLNPLDYREQFDVGVIAANPTLQRIIVEGIVICTSTVGDKIREEAKSDLEGGPLPLTSYDIDVNRYVITEFMMDLKGSDMVVEQWFIAQKMTILLCEFVLRANRQWIGEGKTLFRLLLMHDSRVAADLERSLRLLYVHKDKSSLLELTEKLLKPFGGPYLIGHEE